MPDVAKLISVFEDARELLNNPDNDFLWSSWVDANDAVEEVDGILSALRAGVLPGELPMRVLFAPTGPIQEVSLSSGWGTEFLALSERFDDAMMAADA
jgi:hypothetical protein